MYYPRQAVEGGPELERILALPRRTKPPQGAEDLSWVLRAPHGKQVLRPVQAQALAEIHCLRGLLGAIRVGGGKTLITYLAPTMVGATRPVLLLPAKLRAKTLRDFEDLARHWSGGAVPKILSYEKLGHPGGADDLQALEPDMIIADEVHRLKNLRAACTRRVGRYLEGQEGVVFVGLSGTVTSRSLLDFAHLAEWALGQGAPVPLVLYELEQWGRALDEDSRWLYDRLAPGALLRLAGPEDKGKDEVATARAAYRRRLGETPGVVVSGSQDEVTASIVVEEWSPSGRGRAIDEALRQLERKWETPDGVPLILAVDVWRHARELALGFWYRWEPTPPEPWLSARRAWAARARSVLARSRKYDTEAQVRAALAGDPALEAWDAVRGSYSYSLVPEWFDDSVISAVLEWATVHDGIVWVGHAAIGERLEDRGLPYYGAKGLRGRSPIERAEGAIAASIAANAEGRNLQKWSENLVLTTPTTGDKWEQLIGRTHRFGQTADEVSFEIYLGCEQDRDGFKQALSDARYAADVLGSSQKLLLSNILVEGLG